MKKILMMLTLVSLASCGKGNLHYEDPETKEVPYDYIRPFMMSTNSNHIGKNKIIHVVDLRDVISDFDNLPVSEESYTKIYDLLKVDHQRYSGFTVLINTDDCQALVGYCKAFYIERK